MYAAILQYRIDTGSRNELVKLIEEELAPLLKKVEGFVEYSLLEAEDGMLATISVFEEQAGLEECSRIVQQWMKENLTTLFTFRPKDTFHLSTATEGVFRKLLKESPNGKEELIQEEGRGYSEPPDPLQLLSVDEVSTMLGMGKSWVYRKIKSGELPSIRLGHNIKLKRADLEEYLENQRQ